MEPQERVTRVPPRGVDLLVCHAHIVTMDPQRRQLTDGAVAVADGRIVAVGGTADLRQRFVGRKTLDAAGCLITPGLVNAHQHVTGDVLARGFIPDGLDHATIIQTWFHALHLAETHRDERLSALLACAEMLRYGTTAFLESGTAWRPRALASAVERAGILGVFGKRVWDLPQSPRRFRLTTRAALRALEETVQLIRQRSTGQARPAISLVGHATASDALLVGASDLARAYGLRLAMHLSPVEADVQAFLQRAGRRPVEHLAALGVLGPHVTLVHMIHASEREVDLLAEHGVSVVVCPMTACRLGYGLGRHGRHLEMLARGVTLALGADNASASNTLDLLKIAFLVPGLYGDARQDSSVLGARQVFEMLTVGGARALGLEREIGSLEEGKRADLVMWRRDGPEWQPPWDPLQTLVYATDGRSVDRVIARGRVVVERGRVATLNLRALDRQVRAAAPALIRRSGLLERLPPGTQAALSRCG